MAIYVIAGHGAGDPGACNGTTTEAERVRALASRMKELGGDSVQLADLSRNYYADGGIERGLGIPTDWPVIELHMDSADPSARGGHVIIKDGLEPDAYDRALADFICGMFPGRSVQIDGRGDLANVNRAARRGYNYRLLEVCFISNDGDLSLFNSSIDDVAAGIVLALGGQVVEADGDVPCDELPQSLASFSDVRAGEWYVDDLAYAVERGWLTGYGDGCLGPEDYLTRGQAVCLISRAAAVEFEHPFSDVVASPYYYDAVAWAKETGVVSSEQGSFRPEDLCSRAEFVVMLYNWLADQRGDSVGRLDSPEVPGWASTAMSWAVGRGIVGEGGASLRPNDPCSRAEAVAMIHRCGI